MLFEKTIHKELSGTMPLSNKRTMYLENTVYNKAVLASIGKFNQNIYDILGLKIPELIPFDVIIKFLDDLSKIKSPIDTSEREFEDLKQAIISFLFDLRDVYWKKLNEEFGVEEDVFNDIVNKVVSDPAFSPYTDEDSSIKLQIQETIRTFIEGLLNIYTQYTEEGLSDLIIEIIKKLPVLKDEKFEYYRAMMDYIIASLVSLRIDTSDDTISSVFARGSTFFEFCDNIIYQYQLLLTSASYEELSLDRDDLVSYWDFNVAKPLDIVGDNNGTISGTIVWEQQGNYGGYYSFDGTEGSYIDCGISDSLKIQNQFTISAYINPSNPPNNLGRLVATTYRYDSNSYYLRGWNFGDAWGSDDHFYFQLFDGAGNSFNAVYNNFWKNYQNQWVRVTGVFKAGEFIKLYIDNDLVAESDAPSEVQYISSIPFRIGHRSDNETQGMWYGNISDVILLNQAIDEEGVKELNNISVELQYPHSRSSIKGILGGDQPPYRDEDTDIKTIYDSLFALYNGLKANDDYSEFDIFRSLRSVIEQLRRLDTSIIYYQGGISGISEIDFIITDDILGRFYIRQSVTIHCDISQVVSAISSSQIQWNTGENWIDINPMISHTHYYNTIGLKNISFKVILENEEILTTSNQVSIEDPEFVLLTSPVIEETANVKGVLSNPVTITNGLSTIFSLENNNFVGDIDHVDWEVKTNTIPPAIIKSETHSFSEDFIYNVLHKSWGTVWGNKILAKIFTNNNIEYELLQLIFPTILILDFDLHKEHGGMGGVTRIYADNFKAEYNSISYINWFNNNYPNNFSFRLQRRQDGILKNNWEITNEADVIDININPYYSTGEYKFVLWDSDNDEIIYESSIQNLV